MPASHRPASPADDSRLVVALADLPPEGRLIKGSLPAAVFDLEPGGPQPASPLRFHLHVHRDDDRVNAQGEVSADFSFICVRCLEPFTDRVTLTNYHLEEAITPKTQSVDLTDRVREDILLALPGHPRCEKGSLHPRTCPASSSFPDDGDYSTEHPLRNPQPSESREVWGALDQLDLKSAPSSHRPSRRSR